MTPSEGEKRPLKQVSMVGGSGGIHPNQESAPGVKRAPPTGPQGVRRWARIPVCIHCGTPFSSCPVTTRLIKVRAKHKRVGAVRLLTDLMMTDELSDGFEKLVAGKRVDLTGEAIVINNEELFSVDAVNAARKKLMEPCQLPGYPG